MIHTDKLLQYAQHHVRLARDENLSMGEEHLARSLDAVIKVIGGEGYPDVQEW